MADGADELAEVTSGMIKLANFISFFWPAVGLVEIKEQMETVESWGPSLACFAPSNLDKLCARVA